MSIVKLNVGGYLCQVLSSTLEKSEFFKILLARPEMQTLTNEGDIFIDEDPDDFKIILKLLRGYIYTDALNDNILRLIDYYQITTPLSPSEPKRLVMDNMIINTTGHFLGMRSADMTFVLVPQGFESFHIIVNSNIHGREIELAAIEINDIKYYNYEHFTLFSQKKRNGKTIYEANKKCLKLFQNCTKFGFSTNSNTTCTAIWTKYE